MNVPNEFDPRQNKTSRKCLTYPEKRCYRARKIGFSLGDGARVFHNGGISIYRSYGGRFPTARERIDFVLRPVSDVTSLWKAPTERHVANASGKSLEFIMNSNL